MEYQIRQKPQRTSDHGRRAWTQAFERIIGNKVGQGIQLRHFPVKSVANDVLRHSRRGGPNAIGDAVPRHSHHAQQRNQRLQPRRDLGLATHRVTSLDFAGARFVGGRYQNVVHVTIDYTTDGRRPAGLVQAVVQSAAAFIMEIAGAGTAGISSRSIDGYARILHSLRHNNHLFQHVGSSTSKRWKKRSNDIKNPSGPNGQGDRYYG